jgi:hypothetical protein
MDRINRMLDRIPGYSGYRDKENRRDSDRRVRDQVVAALAKPIESLQALATTLANERRIEAVGPISDTIASTRHLQDRIRTATYGYGGIESDRNVDAAALDQLVAFDTDMLAQADALVPLAKTVASATDGQTRSTALASYSSALTNLGQTWDGRALVIETGRPVSVNAPTSPLTVLEGDSTKPLVPPALSIARGDAISVAGADFIVDATIELFGDQPTKLVRIDSAAERWLIANVRFAADATKAPVTIGSGTATVNGQTLAAHGTGTSEAEVIGVSGSSGRQRASYQVYGGESANGPIAFVLSWPGTDLSLAGHGIQLDDIRVYGQPGNQ